MSSSNSNAAARRRRAGPAVPPSMASRITPPHPPRVNQPPQTQQSQGQQNGTPIPRPVMTPAQMLIAHENRIIELEKAIPEIMQNFVLSEDEQQDNFDAENVPLTDVLRREVNERFDVVDKHTSELSGRVANLENSNMNVDTKELISKIHGLERELATMQKSFNLLRDFATETNVLLMKIFNSDNMVMTSNIEDEFFNNDKVTVKFDNINNITDANDEVEQNVSE
jgi:hypothetical protein